MMDHNNQDRDGVLNAFHEACDVPTRADVERWARLYPAFADDIRDHAAIRIATLAEATDAAVEIDALHRARSRSRVREALFRARSQRSPAARAGSAAAAAASATDSKGATFSQLLAAASLSQADLASQLPIKRAVVADLFAGRMLRPGRRFVDAVIQRLGASRAQFDVALALANRTPTLGMAKARGQPIANQRDYTEIIRNSGMTPEEIVHWLDDD